MSTSTEAAGRRGRAAWAVAAGAAAAGLLAAGCGTTQASAGPSARETASAATPAASATPAPTVSGGSVAPGEIACADWPASAPAGSLPASFVPVKVERCVNGAQLVAGKGLWVTATLEEADSGLAGLVSALRESSQARKPGTVCPELATIAPQIVLVSATGQQLAPALPVTGCGITQSRVLLALGSLHWQTLSVRLVSPVAGSASATPAASGETVSGTPRGEQTLSAANAG
jgi:hypothetical protein